MGLQVVIDTVGVPQLNGTYDLDFEFDHGELHLIKDVAKLRGLEVDDAMEAGDTDLILCLGVIGALRAGRLQPKDVRAAVDELMKEKVGTIQLAESEEAEVPEASAGSEPGETQSSSSSSTTSPSNGHQETTPEAIGVPI